MPEAIEVTLTALYLNHKLKNKKITEISILGGRYSRHPLHDLNMFRYKLPLKIIKIKSKGKFIWFELEDAAHISYFIMNTLGLEGMWTFEKMPHANVLFKIRVKIKTMICIL